MDELEPPPAAPLCLYVFYKYVDRTCENKIKEKSERGYDDDVVFYLYISGGPS